MNWLSEKNASADDQFGNALAMSGNNVVVGARLNDVTDKGAAFLFNVAEITLDIVRDQPRPWEPGPALSNSFGFGGHNGCLAIGVTP